MPEGCGASAQLVIPVLPVNGEGPTQAVHRLPVFPLGCQRLAVLEELRGLGSAGGAIEPDEKGIQDKDSAVSSSS